MVRLYRECRPVEWALREVDVDYFVESITFEESDLEPVTGHPPLIELEGMRLWAPAAALDELGVRFGEPLYPPPNVRPQVRQWIFTWLGWHASGRFDHVLGARRRMMLAPPSDPKRFESELTDAMEAGARYLVALNIHLRANKYVVGGRFTVADIATAESVRRAEEGGADLEPLVSLCLWLGRVSARDAFAAPSR